MMDGGAPPEPGMMDKIRAYVLANRGLGGADVRDAQSAYNVDDSSGAIHGYADGGEIPDLAMLTGGDIPPSSFDIGNQSSTYKTDGSIPPPPPMPMSPPPAMPPSMPAPMPAAMPSAPAGNPLGQSRPVVPPAGPIPGAGAPGSGTGMASILGAAQNAGAGVMGNYTPENRAELMAYLANKQNGMGSSIGNGLASVGDAITRGYGRSQSNFLNDTLAGQAENRKEVMGGFDEGAKQKLAQTQAGLEVEKLSNDSPLARAKQAAFAPLLKQAGLSAAQAANIAPDDIKDVASLAAEMGNKRLAVQLEMTNQMLDRANKAAEDYRSDPDAGKIRDKIQAIDTALPLLAKAGNGDGAAKNQLNEVLGKNELGGTWGPTDIFKGDFSRKNSYASLQQNLVQQRQSLSSMLNSKRAGLMQRATAETRLPPGLINTLFDESTPDLSHTAAVAWAKQNPRDPKAQAVLATAQANGGQNGI